MKLALVTCAALPALQADDRLLLEALIERGIEAEPAVWEDPYLDWSAFDLCLVRSTWDYPYRRDQFVAWAERVAECCSLYNPAQIIRWNTHKGYLKDLAKRGLNVVPTVLFEAGSKVNLGQLLEQQSWTRVVIKPAVGVSGRYTARVEGSKDVSRGQAHLNRFLPHEDMLVQPFLNGLERDGEISIVMIAGEVSHAVRKLPSAGDFRVQQEFGGSVAVFEPSEDEVQLAQQALRSADGQPLYARIDMVRDAEGDPCLMELELVEPELFFSCSGTGIDRMVDALITSEK